MVNIICFGDGSCYNLRAGSKNAMGIGVVMYCGNTKVEFFDYVGEGTSNIAEWEALIAALRMAVPEALKHTSKVLITYKADSQVIVNMFNGIYSAKNFKAEYLRAKYWESKLNVNHRLDVIWIPRADNMEADVLSKRGNPYYARIR